LRTHALVEAAAATPRGAKPTILKRILTLSPFSKWWNYSTTQKESPKTENPEYMNTAVLFRCSRHNSPSVILLRF
jgi:hypothetical protein